MNHGKTAKHSSWHITSSQDYYAVVKSCRSTNDSSVDTVNHEDLERTESDEEDQAGPSQAARKIKRGQEKTMTAQTKSHSFGTP